MRPHGSSERCRPGRPTRCHTCYREPTDLESFNQIAWPVERVAAALGKVAREVLGPRGNQVVRLIDGARQDALALRAACTRARQVTRIFIGADESEELGRRMDPLLARLTKL